MPRRTNKKTIQAKTCDEKLTKRERTCWYALVWLTLVWGIWFCSNEWKDYNRYEIKAWGIPEAESTFAYKLDKETGVVTAIWNLMEYDIDKFKDPNREAKRYDFGPYHAPELHLPTWVK